jgi:hypothetical protein
VAAALLLLLRLDGRRVAHGINVRAREVRLRVGVGDGDGGG